MLALLLAAVLVLPAAARALDAPPSEKRLEGLRRILDFGLWNNRINALYALGEEKRDALPLLDYAADDADWQVRLTAVHFLGKLGPAAAPALGRIGRDEPCPNVRISALRWISGLGPSGTVQMTPEDERLLESVPDRYGTERMGKPLAVDPPDDMNAYFFNGGEDLRVCASSERAGRRPGAVSESARADAEEAPVDFPVRTPPVPPRAPNKEAESASPSPPSAGETAGAPFVALRKIYAPPAPPTPEQKRADAQLDAILTPGSPETLPPGPPGAEASEPAAPGGRFESASKRTLAASGVPAADARPRESFPAGPPAPERAAPAAAEGAIVADMGTGKPENDPIPALIVQLSSPDPRRRARAADELGKRGAAAATAVAALRRRLDDRDRRVRASAVLALGSMASASDGTDVDLRRALRDKDEDVRFSARIALERLESRTGAKGSSPGRNPTRSP
ncbi:MAG: HEAT repeat domain-containing protein [Elusimicrobiota bacterium]